MTEPKPDTLPKPAKPTRVRRDEAILRAQAELLLRARHPERSVTTPWVREPDPEGLAGIPAHDDAPIGMNGL